MAVTDKKSRVRTPALIFAIAVGLFFGVSFYTFYYAQGASYLSNDPKVCTNCHIMREHFDSWQKSSHHNVATCNDCHIPHDFPMKYIVKLENGYNHSSKFTFQNFHEPIQIRESNREVLLRNCLRCHAPLLAESVGTFAHADQHQNCVRCHREVSHGASR